MDLSPAGHQPMESANRRYTIVFNGEIYNHQELRLQLDSQGSAPQYRGHSDTEVLLAAIEAWGLRTAIERTVGMFSIAIWDRNLQTLSLVRDRLGEKPLYYGLHERHVLFGSELKALVAHPAFRYEINRDALALLVRYGYIPSPHSIYERVFKLLPGTILELSASTLRARHKLPLPVPYWSAEEVAELSTTQPFQGTYTEAVHEVERLLCKSIDGQMRADVPVGAFLSGGIDSSTVVALMQSQSARRVKTFSIGFHESDYNEACHAKNVANHIGTEHTELYVTAQQAQQVIPSLPSIYDEPFADSSQIPTYLVAKLACRDVTVSLSGDGGDELFAGYTRYSLAQKAWNTLRRLPLALRRPIGNVLGSLPASQLKATLFWLKLLTNRHDAPARISNKICRLAELLRQDGLESLYFEIVSLSGNSDLLQSHSGSRSLVSDPYAGPRLTHPQQRMMYLDLITYLPDDILVKVDRAAMAVSLETRVPLLDHRLVEFAWSLPMSFKRSAGRSKAILRDVLAKYVPPELTERPKMGFGVPIGDWLRGPLRDWAHDLLDEQRLMREAFSMLTTCTASGMSKSHLNASGNARFGPS